MQKKIEVQCQCDDKETIGSLMTKITDGAAELDRLLTASPMDMLSHSIFHTKPCIVCEGTCKVYYPNGPEDYDVEPCQPCNGTGRVVANN